MNNSGHFVLTLDATVQRLSSVFEAGDSNGTGTITWLSVQPLAANSGVVYGGFFGCGLSSTNYGWRLEAPVSTIPPAPFIIEGQITSLDKIVVKGTDTDKIAVSYSRS